MQPVGLIRPAAPHAAARKIWPRASQERNLENLGGGWFETHDKQLVWFEDSAHMVYEEESGKLLVSLVNLVRPLAVERQAAAKQAAPHCSLRNQVHLS